MTGSSATQSDTALPTTQVYEQEFLFFINYPVAGIFGIAAWTASDNLMSTALFLFVSFLKIL